jgi:hypothetical protein
MTELIGVSPAWTHTQSPGPTPDVKREVSRDEPQKVLVGRTLFAMSTKV